MDSIYPVGIIPLATARYMTAYRLPHFYGLDDMLDLGPWVAK